MGQRIFISYARRDRRRVVALKKLLEALGHEVFVDSESIRGGTAWEKALMEALEQAEILVVFWTHHAAKSEWVSKEYTQFLAWFPKRRCVPLQAGPTPLPSSLARRQDPGVMPLLNELFDLQRQLHDVGVSRAEVEHAVLEHLRDGGVDLSRRDLRLLLYGSLLANAALVASQFPQGIRGQAAWKIVPGIAIGVSLVALQVCGAGNIKLDGGEPDTHARLELIPPLPAEAGQTGREAVTAGDERTVASFNNETAEAGQTGREAVTAGDERAVASFNDGTDDDTAAPGGALPPEDQEVDGLAFADGPALYQAAFDRQKSQYQFGYRSIPRIDIVGAPADTDFARWATLHDGKDYRLYCFRRGHASLYQYGFNRKTNRYEHGFNSIPEIQIAGAPGDADLSSFAMLHDGKTFRLYFLGKQKSTTLYQFGFNVKTSRYEFGHDSIPQVPITGAPPDADLNRWGMLHDGQYFRLYTASKSDDASIHQFGFDPRASRFAYGYNSIPTIPLVGTPSDADSKSFALLHDGTDFWFYRQRL